MYQLPNTKLLQAFEASARHLSFTLAGKELFLSQSAVSRQVKTLEDTLDLQLFVREGKTLVLTEKGTQLFETLKVKLTDISTAITHIKGGQSQRLHIKAPPSFASRWLAPRLCNFFAQHPIPLSLHTGDAVTSLTYKRFDCEIVFGNKFFAELGAALLFWEQIQPACSPALLQKIESGHISDLPLLNTLANFSPLPYWEHWATMNPNSMFSPSRSSLFSGIEFTTQEQAINAALEGLGIVMIDVNIASLVLKNKELIPLGDPVVTPFGYWVYPPTSDQKENHANQTFQQWLMSETGYCTVQDA